MNELELPGMWENADFDGNLDSESSGWLDAGMDITAVPHLADHTPVDEHDTPEIHTHSTTDELKPCWGCWCYSCGGRTDRPRARRGDTRQGLDDPDSHRWCYE